MPSSEKFGQRAEQRNKGCFFGYHTSKNIYFFKLVVGSDQFRLLKIYSVRTFYDVTVVNNA